MDRFTISLPSALAEAFDGWIARRGYGNRSEAVRDLVRATLEADAAPESDDRIGVGALSYVYDHHDHTVTTRLAHAQHRHHDLVVATLHAHLDHDRCLEVSLLRGPPLKLTELADAVIAMRGIRHGHLRLIREDAGTGPWIPPHEHDGGPTHDPARHTHEPA